MIAECDHKHRKNSDYTEDFALCCGNFTIKATTSGKQTTHGALMMIGEERNLRAGWPLKIHILTKAPFCDGKQDMYKTGEMERR